jgi:PAS domain S-box-containing protein
MALVIISIVLFLVFQFFSVAMQFYNLGSQYLLLDRDANVAKTLFEHATDTQKIHDILGLIYLKSFIYLLFVIELVLQVKYMIQHPLDTMKDRLSILNSGDIKNATSIDIVSNDEFSRVFQEINTLIERQQSELECSSMRLESIVDQAADPIIAFDTSGTILLFNPAAELFFGYTEDEAKSTPLASMIELPKNELCLPECSLTETLIDHLCGEGTAIHRFMARRKDGSRVMFESNVSHAENADTTIYTAILRDITRQIEFEQALTSAKVSAENANRLKTEFLANMSHELRTPLNAVLGFTQLLSSDRNLTPGQLEKIQIISRSGEHLLSLINDILDISKIEAGKQEIHESVFDPARFVGDIEEMFSLRCQKAGLSLYVEITGELPKTGHRRPRQAQTGDDQSSSATRSSLQARAASASSPGRTTGNPVLGYRFRQRNSRGRARGDHAAVHPVVDHRQRGRDRARARDFVALCPDDGRAALGGKRSR